MGVEQTANNSRSTFGLTLSNTLTSVNAGAVLIIGLSTSSSSGSRVFSVADDRNGAWTNIVKLAVANRQVEVWRFSGSASGTVVVTVTCTNTQIWRQGILEVTGFSGTAEATDSLDNPNSNPMYAMNATGFNVSAGSLVIGCIAPQSAIGTPTLDSDYTVLTEEGFTPPQGLGVVAYRIIGGSPITNERMEWQGTTTFRTGPGCAASFPVAAAAAFKPYYRRRAQTIGAGI